MNVLHASPMQLVRSSWHCRHLLSSLREPDAAHPLSASFDVHHGSRHHHRIAPLRPGAGQRKLLAMGFHPDGKMAVAMLPINTNSHQILSTVAVDFIFNVSNIYFSTKLPARQQGLAGSLSNATLQLGIALMLGFAEIIATGTSHQGLRESYQNVFWFNLACGATALTIFMLFVRIARAKSDFTADEKEELEKAAAAEH